MRVLIGCEESGTVRDAFISRGHDAWSCDLVSSRGNHPEKHYQEDIMQILNRPWIDKWDLILLHPDCTAMAVSGNRWYGRGMPKHGERKKAINWTIGLWQRACEICDRVALENPVSVIFQHLDTPVHYVHPWQFGHGETKKTGFALNNLPPLVSTNIVDGREQRVWRMPPSETRKRDRSKTYSGIADAIADQWGRL